MKTTSLRRQIQIYVGSSLFIMVVVLGAVFQFILYRDFANLEQRQATRDYERAGALLDREMKQLDEITSDWSAWDETWYFARGESPDYPSLNLMGQTFTNLKINLIAIYDPSGKLLTGRFWNLQEDREKPLPYRFHALLPGDYLNVLTLNGKKLSGLVSYDSSTMMVAAQAITTSLRDKPAAGVIVFGRELTPLVITHLSEDLGLTLGVFPVSTLPENLRAKMSQISADRPLVEVRDADTLAAYGLYPGLDGKPALLLAVEEGRPIMVQGVRTIIVIAVTLVLISFFVGVVVTWLSNRHVVKPLSQLSEEVARIGREGDWKARLPSSSSRELASLSDNFNQMLTQLVMAHHQEQEMAAQEKKARERAESEIRKRADYTRALVHELKTPLTAISASIQLLNEEVTGTASTRLVSNIARGTANLTKRIDELLDLAKGEVGILGVNPAPMDARQLVYDLVGELKSIAIEKKLALDLVIPEGSIPAVLDGVRLRQILTNLIGNALKFTPEGGVIKVKVDKVDGDLIIAVTDNGPGIPPEEIPKIFEPYHRLSNIHGRLSGLGVGLAISRMLTELHGGSLTVDSLPGRGSTFRVSLPIAGTKADEQPD